MYGEQRVRGSRDQGVSAACSRKGNSRCRRSGARHTAVSPVTAGRTNSDRGVHKLEDGEVRVIPPGE
jgi:hypothetical protein